MAIIEALHHVREHADTNLVFAIKNVDIPSYGEEELKRKLEASMAALRMHRDFGTLVVSEDAIDLMNKLFGELDESTQTNDWQFHLEMKLKAIDCCLPEMLHVQHIRWIAARIHPTFLAYSSPNAANNSA